MDERNQLKKSNNQNIDLKKTVKSSLKSHKKLEKSIYQVYNLNKIGSIKFAKIHQSASRPLHKVEDRIDDDELEFCKCCKLPAEQKGLLEKFKFCEDPDNFISCGEGISLYFTFFKLAIIALLIMFVLTSLYNIIFSKKYYDEIYNLCNRKQKNNLIAIDCSLFTESSKNTSTNTYVISESFFFAFNSVNTKFYRNIFYNLTSKTNTNIEKVIVNTSYMNFICLITLFIFNIYCIIIINSESQNINISILSLSDYSLFLTHVRHVLRTFLRERKEILEKKALSEQMKGPYNYKEELYNRLGIDNSLLNSSDLEQFFSFLKNKIFVNSDGTKVNIKKINLCFKLSKLMELQEEENDIDEKMSKIKNHPFQIAKNEELELKGKDRKFFSSFLNLKCFEKGGQSLLELEQQQKKLREEIEILMKNTKEETLDYFSGCMIICVDTLAEQEQFLNENKSITYFYLLNFLRYIFCRFTLTPSAKDINKLRKTIRFERAPEPEDIKFENLEYANSISRVSRTFLVYFFSIFLILICFITVTALNSLQKYTDEKYDYDIGVAYTISLLITCNYKYNFRKTIGFFNKIRKITNNNTLFFK